MDKESRLAMGLVQRRMVYGDGPPSGQSSTHLQQVWSELCRGLKTG